MANDIFAPPTEDELRGASQPDIFAPPTQEEIEKNAVAPDRPMQSAMQGFGNALTLGYLPHLQAMAEPALAKVYDVVTGENVSDDMEDYVGRRDRNIKRQDALKEQNPLSYGAGTVAGALSSALAIPGGAALQAGKGAGVGALAARGAATGAAMGAISNPGDIEGETGLQLGDRLKGAALGASLGAAVPAVTGGASKLLSKAGEAMKTKPKASIDDILEAAESLGVKPTAGMRLDSKRVQNLESSLAKSPTLVGEYFRKSRINPLYDKLDDASEKLFEKTSPLSETEVGSKVRESILSKFGEKLDPARSKFQELSSTVKSLPADPKSIKRFAKSVDRIDQVRLAPSSAPASLAKRYAQDFQNAQSVDDIMSLRQMLGKDLANAQANRDANATKVLGDLYDKATRLEEKNILRGAISASGSEKAGTKAAREIISEFRQAKKGYRGAMDFAKSASEAGGLPKYASKGPEAFADAIESVDASKLPSKFFNLGKIEQSKKLAQEFPEEFEMMRRLRLSDLKDKAVGSGEKMSPARLGSATKQLEPEALEMLFGKTGTKALSDIDRVQKAIPKDFNPSGTASGLELMSFGPGRIATEASALGRLGALKMAETGANNTVAQGLIRSSEPLKRLSESNPAAFQMLLEGLKRKSGFDPKEQTKDVPSPEAKGRFISGN